MSLATLLKVSLDLTVCVIDEDIEEHQSQDRSLRDTTCHQPPPGHRDINLISLAVSIQSISYLPNSPSIKFEDKHVVWDCVKGLTEI
ncbi:testosterone 17-beta-dehydrogenase 3-like [Pitangus sulphuratus]|nr:testosterone 17-beta-dehydrogenase 3-like [Pitangus sulphuratus]